MRVRSLFLVTIAGGAVTTVALLGSCSSSSDDGAAAPQACIELAKKCTNDGECCANLKCMWQGDGAYCQPKSAQDPLCQRGEQDCTQDSHCCGKSCVSGKCALSESDKSPTGSSGGSACTALGGNCNSSSSCCSRFCKEDPNTTKSICVEPDPGTLPNPRGGCGVIGDQCTLPQQCCSNNCLVGHCVEK